jgi:hypothetical protein
MLPRLMYFRAVLHAYRGILPDMDACIADLLAHLQATGQRLHTGAA